MENETFDIKPKSMFIPICVAQSVCIVVLLIAVLIIKLGFNDTFTKLQKWCQKNLLEPTYITAEFDGEKV